MTGRERLIRQHLDQGRCMAESVDEGGISERIQFEGARSA
jgi:hypothetical protein